MPCHRASSATGSVGKWLVAVAVVAAVVMVLFAVMAVMAAVVMMPVIALINTAAQQAAQQHCAANK